LRVLVILDTLSWRAVEYSRFEYFGQRFRLLVLWFVFCLFSSIVFLRFKLSHVIEKRWKDVEIEAEVESKNGLERRSL